MKQESVEMSRVCLNSYEKGTQENSISAESLSKFEQVYLCFKGHERYYFMKNYDPLFRALSSYYLQSVHSYDLYWIYTFIASQRPYSVLEEVQRVEYLLRKKVQFFLAFQTLISFERNLLYN